MTTDNNRIFNQIDNNFNDGDPSYVDQYLKEHMDHENEQEIAATEEQNNLDSEFEYALDVDDFENDFDENDLEENNSGEEDQEENYDENAIDEPETFEDDGYKID